MISFISRFKVFATVIVLILLTETAIAFYGKGSPVYRNNFLELAYHKRVSPQKFIIMKKLQELAAEKADYVSVGDSTGLFGLQPLIIQKFLNGKKMLNLSTAGDAGYNGYRYMAEYYLKHHDKGRVLMAAITPFILPSDFAGTPMATSIRDNYLNQWRHVLLPNFSWRLMLTNWLYYDELKDEPFAYRESDGAYPPLSVWNEEIMHNKGWLDFPVRAKVNREDCTFRTKSDKYDKTFRKELQKFVRLSHRYDSELILLLSPVSCVDAGHHSDYLEMELDRFAIQNRDVFIPFGLIDTWPLEDFGDEIHLKQQSSARYSLLVGQVLAKHARGEAKNYYGDSFDAMTSGVLDGEVRTYFPTGELKTKRIYRKGIPVGQAVTYYMDGRTRAVREYKNGMLAGDVISYYPNGDPEYRVHFEHGRENGRSYRYFPGGRLRDITDYKDGLKHGKVILFNSNGQKALELTTVNDRANGPGVHYYPNGQPQMKVHYHMDLLHGTAEYYDPSGNLIKTSRYVRGKEVR